MDWAVPAAVVMGATESAMGSARRGEAEYAAADSAQADEGLEDAAEHGLRGAADEVWQSVSAQRLPVRQRGRHACAARLQSGARDGGARFPIMAGSHPRR